MSITLLLSFFVFMSVGLPIAISLGGSTLLALVLFTDTPVNLIVQSMFSSMNSFVMVAVPLFILAGIIMDEGGVAEKIFDFARKVVGWLPGGLGHVTIVANVIFAGMSGSSVAEVASIGNLSIKAMTKNKYPLPYATSLALATSMLATIIPPSILMVIASSIANVSIGQALVAGIIPGFVIAVIFMLYNTYYCKKHGIGEREKFSLKELGKSFIDALPALLAPVILMGGILSGYFTPTESAAIAVLYTLIVALFIYKGISLRQLPEIFFRTTKMTGTILFIAVTAAPASWVFQYDGLPAKVATLISGVSQSPFLIMLILLLFFIIVGMFMDATAAIFILIPILMPAIHAVGINPVFFVVFIVIVLSFGLITPPVGVCLYAASNLTGLTIEVLTKSSMRWMYITVGILMLFIIFPSLITTPLRWFGM